MPTGCSWKQLRLPSTERKMKSSENIDPFGRAHTYARVSVTAKCNLSCRYCAPGAQPSPCPIKKGGGGEISLPEILEFIRALGAIGVEKVRFTGGEPLVRPDIEQLVAGARAITAVKKVCLTTNGILLAGKAAALKDAGLDALNVSLDSLDRGRFERITGSDGLAGVRAGIDRALALGFKPKINAVALADLSYGEIDAFVKFASENRLTVRFIELMPFCEDDFTQTAFAPISRLENYLAQKYSAGPPEADGVARNYRINGGKIGFISALSHPFCGSCDRLRLSSRGVLYRCLFDSTGLDVKTLRDESAGNLPEHIRKFLAGKKEFHGISSASPADLKRVKNSMRLIGG